MLIPFEKTTEEIAKHDTFYKILMWVTTLYIWIIGVIVIRMIYPKITGHSPTLPEISLAVNMLILGVVFGIGLSVNKVSYQLKLHEASYYHKRRR